MEKEKEKEKESKGMLMAQMSQISEPLLFFNKPSSSIS